MSGNTSAGGAFAGTFDGGRAARQLFPLPLFVGGIYVGALIVQAAQPEAQRRRYAVVLAIECGLIALVLGMATLAGVTGAVPLEPPARFFGLAAPLAVAMGLQNAMRMDVRGANLATTYVTGTLQRGGPGAGPGHRARPPRAGNRVRGARYAHPGQPGGAGGGDVAGRLGGGFLVGALAGGALFTRAGLDALLLPLALLLVLVTDTLRRTRP